MDTVRTGEAIQTLGSKQVDAQAPKILARTMYRDMISHGLSPEQILAIASELISQVTHQLKQEIEPPSGRA